MTCRLLVVAGEISGDRMAARVLKQLRQQNPELQSFGLGGDALAAQGLELCHHLREVAAMGFIEVVVRAGKIFRLARGLLRLAVQRRPQAALLVGFSELNGWLGPKLRQLGIRVLWYAPPQVWAWRPGRVPRLAQASDALALILPFEKEAWRHAQVESHYVGHPALDVPVLSAPAARSTLGLPLQGDTVLLLPGSRIQEIRRLTPLLLSVGRRLQERGIASVRLAAAPSLPENERCFLMESCRSQGIEIRAIEPNCFSAFDLAIACSGTATLECALAGAPPLIVYLTDRFTAALARALLRVDQVGLPNLVLHRQAFPEFLQEEASLERLTEAALSALASREALIQACRELQHRLAPNPGPMPAARVAALLQRWLPDARHPLC